MDKRQLYNTGTVMNNRICKDLRWNAQKARKMERGEYNRHLYQYKNDMGQKKSIGLVIWKDKKPVYVLTSELSTVEEDICKRRSKQGILDIKRPVCIAQYNKYMGGVDLADQRRLFCESRVHGLQRWWIFLLYRCRNCKFNGSF